MKRNLFSAFLLSSALLLGACNNEKAGEVGATGMNAAANEAAANPVVDNPNVTNETAAPNPNAPVMTFAVSEHDFGDIQPGSVVKHTFEFTNTGKSPLLIENATASCGCTTPNWTKEPIAPGAKGTIDVQFDSHGKMGIQNKEVAIQANTQPNITKVVIKANVLSDGAAGPVRQ
ncbi:DUF1573 domain-containing protein [Hymenobacter taeanensis]|uniref:DUF1573 domain-containing protein n=1 Tax=Hymenobacter taeanensis TaxID=2735321 RepID=A0A6M6BF44_9BACT|nr:MULTISPECIES: DUF1573 domain-containing protein [Hymenobacter]QJX46876.1 DUF1573 domain-containing protein [Hymenobacter taeanensis]UOQ80748.1 DUF1573 domain-containing protein [Hymenobacter sp. 5414T-23]